MLTVTIDQSEGISRADIPEQAVKKMRTGSAALSLPSSRAFFSFLITERLSTTISEPGTGYQIACMREMAFQQILDLGIEVFSLSMTDLAMVWPARF